MSEHFLTDIEIKQFKCFTDFKASGFKRVNLLGGKNNIGKTALMEAIYINVRSTNINKMTTAIHSMKFSRDCINILDNLLNSKKLDPIKTLNSIKVYSAISNKFNTIFEIKESDAFKEYYYKINEVEKTVNANEFSLILQYTKNIMFIDSFGLFDRELIELYKSLQVTDKEEYLNHYIREFDDSIENFKVIDKPQCKTNGVYRDITEFGDGLKHYISIICSLYACENGYLFIDEIDNGIYYEHFDRLWEIIFTLSKQTNCQVFATTHSKEMLESFARVAEKHNEQDISYTLLVKNKKQEIKTISLEYKDVIDSVINQGHEVR